MTIIFKNDAILPLECISTFGVSAKDTDSPIGYFGTGLKYAIAVLLREGCKIQAMIGGELFDFTLHDTAVRGKRFNFIHMNGTPLPFTTELGKNWSLWQAYRELYSNCMDEKGEVLTSLDGIDIYAGTVISVEGLDTIHKASDTFILRSEPKHVVNDVEIHENGPTGVFYKGIKVLDLPTKFTYNILDGLTLTEDRTVSQYSAEYAITTAISGSSDLDMLMDVLSITDEQFHEARFNWSKYHTPSEAFMRFVEKMKNRSHALGSYFNHHHTAFMGKLSRAVLNDVTTRKLNKLRGLMAFKPAEIFVADMNEDYKIIDEGLIINAKLLAQPKRLQFAYMVACHKMRTKKPHQSDYYTIAENMLNDFYPKTQRQRKLANSTPFKKAA